jgi:cephalosporin hydroxylase
VITVDLEKALVTVDSDGTRSTYGLETPEGFALISKVWLRAGWDAKYVYGFSWMGRPVIQLPEDLIRVQEAIYAVKANVVIETGVAHGGSLVFYAGLLKAMGGGRVIGIDIEIRSPNRRAIEAHELAPMITLVEGSSTAPAVVEQVRSLVEPSDRVFVMLDSNHSKAHVLAELLAYADLVTPGSYMVAADGIMADLKGAPRSHTDWDWNNPRSAAAEFLRQRPNFVARRPAVPFNEGAVAEPVTYWPEGWLLRLDDRR